MNLITDRLIIRSWREEDIEDYASIIAKSSVMKYIGDGGTYGQEGASKFIARSMAHEREFGWVLWAVEQRQEAKLLGFCGFAELSAGYVEQNDCVEIGWRLDQPYWNQGYGTEAAKAVLEYGLAAYHFPLVASVAQIENTGSIRIMQKIGLNFDKYAVDLKCDRRVVVYSRSYS